MNQQQFFIINYWDPGNQLTVMNDIKKYIFYSLQKSFYNLKDKQQTKNTIVKSLPPPPIYKYLGSRGVLHDNLYRKEWIKANVKFLGGVVWG